MENTMSSICEMLESFTDSEIMVFNRVVAYRDSRQKRNILRFLGDLKEDVDELCTTSILGMRSVRLTSINLYFLNFPAYNFTVPRDRVNMKKHCNVVVIDGKNRMMTVFEPMLHVSLIENKNTQNSLRRFVYDFYRQLAKSKKSKNWNIQLLVGDQMQSGEACLVECRKFVEFFVGGGLLADIGKVFPLTL